ncbi:MAG: nucleotide-binding protein [Proteobacteria bacterium]|nr:nucleotide-binding protein [Pseudomonadota bacterium]
MKTVFYSWQMDTNRDTNKNFLKEVLKLAISKVNEKEGFEIVKLDMDTQNRLGFIDINKIVLEKIVSCDVFVADITSIGKLGEKATPNPNVLLELGYALGRIGEERIIGFANEYYEKIENYPFDLKTRRPFLYNISESDIQNDKKKVKAEAIRIASSIADIIREMIRLEKPAVLLSEISVTRERDIIKLRNLMERIPVKFIHKIIELGKDSLSVDTDYLTIYYNIAGIVNFAYFRMYDSELQKHIFQFTNALSAVYSHGHEFFHVHGTLCRMLHPTDSQEKTFIKEIFDLEGALGILVDYVFINYVEIDLEEANTKAFNHYIQQEKELNDLYEIDEDK